jgi:hypothetical protein
MDKFTLFTPSQVVSERHEERYFYEEKEQDGFAPAYGSFPTINVWRRSVEIRELHRVFMRESPGIPHPEEPLGDESWEQLPLSSLEAMQISGEMRVAYRYRFAIQDEKVDRWIRGILDKDEILRSNIRTARNEAIARANGLLELGRTGLFRRIFCWKKAKEKAWKNV